ncbi:MAG: hypothetical protein IMZ50_09555 [Candidatus Atribacteria bacterium]|nr:hypothetical protein [Candidatus Atribacteria bacterium]
MMENKSQNFEDLWKRVIACGGQTFYTKIKLPFTYRVEGNLVYPSRTSYHISKNDFKKAYELGYLEGPGKINRIVRGPAYVWAILNDKRILPTDKRAS